MRYHAHLADELPLNCLVGNNSPSIAINLIGSALQLEPTVQTHANHATLASPYHQHVDERQVRKVGDVA